MKVFKRVGIVATAALMGFGMMAFGGCDEDEATITDPKEIQSETLADATAWNAAMNVTTTSFTVEGTITMNLDSIIGGYAADATMDETPASSTINFLGKVSGNVMYVQIPAALITMTNTEANMDVYLVAETGAVGALSVYAYMGGAKYYSVRYEEGLDEEYDTYASIFDGSDIIGETGELSFDNFTYSAEDKGYVYVETEDGETVKMIVKFLDGKLAAVIVEDSDVSLEARIYDYDKTTISLPADATGAVRDTSYDDPTGKDDDGTTGGAVAA